MIKNQPSSQFASSSLSYRAHPPHFYFFIAPPCARPFFAICHFQSPNKWGGEGTKSTLHTWLQRGPPTSSPPPLPPVTSSSWSRRPLFGDMRTFKTESSTACGASGRGALPLEEMQLSSSTFLLSSLPHSRGQPTSTSFLGVAVRGSMIDVSVAYPASPARSWRSASMNAFATLLRLCPAS